LRAQLNLLLIDALLKAYNAPRVSELLRRLRELREEVTVTIVVGDNEASKLMKDVIASISSLSGKITVWEKEGTSFKYAPPEVAIGGGLGNRLVYHGLMDGILLCPFIESILYAGRVLEPPALEEEPGSHHLVLFVVPGRPCLETLRTLIPLVAAATSLRLDVVDAREYERRGGRLPSPYVPALLVDDRLARIGSVKSIGEALRVIEAG